MLYFWYINYENFYNMIFEETLRTYLVSWTSFHVMQDNKLTKSSQLCLFSLFFATFNISVQEKLLILWNTPLTYHELLLWCFFLLFYISYKIRVCPEMPLWYWQVTSTGNLLSVRFLLDFCCRKNELLMNPLKYLACPCCGQSITVTWYKWVP
jgi:hypothetical protein